MEVINFKERYERKLKNDILETKTVLDAITNAQGGWDQKLRAIDLCIGHFQDIKRSLLFFLNTDAPVQKEPPVAMRSF